MGFDISYHPVDVEFLERNVIGFVLGETSIDPLLRRGTQIAKNRYRANEWGLGVNKLIDSARSDWRPTELPEPSLLDRLLGRQPKVPPILPDPFEFETDVYIWGRPFFITEESPVAVSASIDSYLEADDAGVDSIAKRMMELLKPGLSSEVTPYKEGPFPSDSEFLESFTADIWLMAEAFKRLPSGASLRLPNGESQQPAEIIQSHFPLTAISFASHFRPGWMARGYVWPTELLRQASLPTSTFVPATELFRSVSKAFPSLRFEFETTITNNFMLGGYVPPALVSQTLSFFANNIDAIVKPAKAGGWEYGCRLELRKITEALRDAEARGFGFLEAAEIYSGPLGIMN
jgi:hypothetical protein